jgi:hypothetical protein
MLAAKRPKDVPVMGTWAVGALRSTGARLPPVPVATCLAADVAFSVMEIRRTTVATVTTNAVAARLVERISVGISRRRGL